jgi:hypothetical protein
MMERAIAELRSICVAGLSGEGEGVVVCLADWEVGAVMVGL